MIFNDFARALSQMGDPRFRRVVFLGVLLAVFLLMGAYAGLLWLVDWMDPGSVEIPLVGPVEGLGTLLSLSSILLMIVLSVFLMIPTAAAFSGLFLEDVADAVEDRFYPDLPYVTPRGYVDNLIDVANFMGLFLLVNLVLLAALALGPLYVPLYWAANGLLIGREYFSLVAGRRMDRAAVRALRRRHFGQVWLAGMLMAAPLSVPLVNLIIPVLGVATFTHMFHRLVGKAPPAPPGFADVPKVRPQV